MTHHQTPPSTLPHHKLIAYQVAIEFATALGALRIADARIREQARKSTIGCVLNIAEGAGRRSRADKSRVYAIALGEGNPRDQAPQRHAAVDSDGAKQQRRLSSPLHFARPAQLRPKRHCAWLFA